MRRLRVLVTIALCLIVACGKSESSAPNAEPARDPAVAAPDPCANTKPHGVLRWIEDDFASALACAKAT
ncbi:MAG: hypothetical protein H0V17_01785, partial [Deltaproteobacteria bacterium]|nr:hypothetical protein [Deltaproteobacteria bacterium]